MWLQAARTSVIFGLARIPSFLLPIIVSYRVGASVLTDTLFFALSISGFILTCVPASVESLSVPLFAQAKANRGGGSELRSRLQLLALVLTGTLVLVVSGSVFVLPARHVDPSELAFLTLILGLVSVLSAISSPLVGSLHVEGRFLSAQGLSALGPVGGAMGAFLAPLDSLVLWIVVGLISGELLRFACLRRASADLGGHGGEEVPRYGRLMRTIIVQGSGSIALAACPLIDRSCAEALGAGALTELSYADRMTSALFTLPLAGFSMVGLAKWSNLYQDRGAKAMSRVVSLQAAGLAGAFAGVALLLWPLVGPLVKFVYGQGRLEEPSLSSVGSVVMMSLPALPVYVWSIGSSRALLVLGRSDVLTGIATLQLGMKIVLTPWLMSRHHVLGAPISTLIGVSVASVLQFLLLNRAVRRRL
jgi:peptidoglycan biosynthesis protein MviN/MurJ (putative lipid II flippase)